MIIWLCKLLSVLEYGIEPKSYPVAKTCYLLHMNDASLIFIYGMKYIISQACFLQVGKISWISTKGPFGVAPAAALLGSFYARASAVKRLRLELGRDVRAALPARS
jgi:hypothetical protein